MPTTLRLIARSFAPFDEFGHILFVGGGYEGDNRGFSPRLDATSRVSQTTIINFDTPAISSNFVQSSPSTTRGRVPGITARVTGVMCEITTLVYEPHCSPHELIDLATVRATAISHSNATMNVVTNTTFRVVQNYDGVNPLFRIMAPSIDVTNSITFRRDLNESGQITAIRIGGQLTGDRFPNAEVILADSQNNAILLHTFQTDWGPDSGPMGALPFNTSSSMGDYYNIIVYLNNGIIQSIGRITISTDPRTMLYVPRESIRTFNITDWNRRFITAM